jgi:hypothetical protein
MNSKHDSEDPEELLVGDDEEEEEEEEASEQQEDGVDAREVEEGDEEDDDEEEEEDDGDDEGEEQEDDDVSEWDRMSAQRVVAVLKESVQRKGWLDFSWEGSSMMLSLATYTEEDMEVLEEEIFRSRTVGSEAGWDRLVKCIVVDIEEHSLGLASKITDVLDCFNLTSLEWFSIYERSSFLNVFDDELEWIRHVVDHYVEWMTATTSIPFPERVSHIFLDCLGDDPEVWNPFVARFSGITEIWLVLRERARLLPNASRHAEALAESTRALPQLESLGVEVHAAGLSNIFLSFLRELVPMPTLAEFGFEVHAEPRESGSYLSAMELNYVYKFVAFSTSLKDVTLDVDEDFTALFDLLVKYNVTLQRIQFCKHVQDSDTKAKIEWLVTLNRYNRRCLLGTAPPPLEEMDALSVVAPVASLPEGIVSGFPSEGNKQVAVTVGRGPHGVGMIAPIPAGAWPLVLGPISADNRADVMYHFLGKMPKSLWLQRSPPACSLKRPFSPSDQGPH